MRIGVFIPILITAMCTPSGGDDRLDFFERRVRPLLVEKCGDCHGANEPESRLTLTSVVGIAAGGSMGAILTPGKPDQSRLIQSVRYTSKLKMPPDGRLPDDEIAVLEQWVRDGAAMPGQTIATRPRDKSGRMRITDEDRTWWSFQPVDDFRPPRVQSRERVGTAVDPFVLRQLEQHGLELSPEADRRTLIRRITFDLIGLPPTSGDVDAFVHDDRPDAFENLVDRLLASPHYGERWGRHWLDVARYADTNGGGFDYVYPHAWRYRDYVVSAFNQDKPYDRFLVEQLAGDLLLVGRGDQEYVDRLTATGLLTLAPKGLGMQDKEQMVLDVVDDQIDVLGRSLLGLTLSCARCHDHKFDPIPTEDYYALAGIFRSTTSLIDTNKNPSYWPERPLERPSVTQARKAWQARRTANEQAVAELKKNADATVISRARERLPEYLIAAAKIRQSIVLQPAVAHWPFDEVDDVDVNATTGPDGVLSNVDDPDGQQPVRVVGRIGNALRFAGRRDVVAFEPHGFRATTDDKRDQSVVTLNPWNSLDFGTATDFSVSLWIRAADGYSPQTADTILNASYSSALWFIALRPGPYNGIYLRHYDGKRSVDIKPSANRLPLLTDGGWHHVVFTSDRDGKGSVYLDGEKAGEVPIGAISPAAQFNRMKAFSLGASTNQFRGDMDDVAIWNRLLLPREVRTLFEKAAGARRNVAQIEQERRRSREESGLKLHDFSDEQMVEQGLVPSIVRRFVDLLAAAEVDPESPLFSLAGVAPMSDDEVRSLLSRNSDAIQKLIDDKKTGPFVPGGDVAMFYAAAAKKRLSELAAEAELIEQTRVPEAVMAMVAFDASEPADLRVHLAGDRRNQGDVVPRGFPNIVAFRSAEAAREDDATFAERKATIPDGRSGRLELARWLTSSEHPLTARVFVNRVWQWHFGEGLVRTSDNFGRLGERPSHPELLDWLARRFMQSGWSVKRLHRQIVLSSTWRQSSRIPSTNSGPQSVDSGNRLLWRMNRRRLEGEALRDAMLSASGQLDPRLGGTVNSWKSKMFSVDDANAETANYATHRRSIYLPVVRGAALHEMLQLFDFGDPNSITARRDVTTVAPQALFLMNSPFVLEQAEKLATRVARHGQGDVAEQILFTYRLTLSRSPTPAEQDRVIAFLGKAHPEDWRTFCQMLLCLNEFAFVE